MKTILIDMPKYNSNGPNRWCTELIKLNKERFVYLGLTLNNLFNQRYKIVHLYKIEGLSILAALIFRLTFRKVIFTLHGDFIRETSSKNYVLKLPWLLGHLLVIFLSNKITIPSIFLLKRMSEQLTPFRKKMKLVYNPYQFLEKIPLKKRTGDIFEVTSFRLKEKMLGTRNLIEAVEEFNSRYHQNIKLGIYGSGKYLNSLKNKIKSEEIIFHGLVPDFKRQEEFRLFVHWSFIENYPYVILESINKGIVTFSYDVGGINEILDRELLFRNKEELISKLEEYFIKKKAGYISMLTKIRNKLIKRNIEIKERFTSIYLS